MLAGGAVVAASALVAGGGHGRTAPRRAPGATRPRSAVRARFATCNEPGYDDLTCFDVTVPLDRSGRVPGTLTLHVAERVGSGGADTGPVLLALSGGPGQAGAILAGIVPDVAESFGVDTSAVTVIGVDQRGTGGTALECAGLQHQVLADLTDAEPGSVEACGRDLGARRGLYRTADTIADLEDVRAILKIPRWAVYGVSYGSYVAGRYARLHPDRVTRVAMDAVVPSGRNVDALQRPNLRAIGRVLRRVCSGGRCPWTRDVAADVGRLARRLAARPRRAATTDADGARISARLDDVALADAVVDASVVGALGAAPAAIDAALRGDDGPLVKLWRQGAGYGGVGPDQYSQTLHAATLCADLAEPWGGPATPLAARAAALGRLRATLQPAETAPFPPSTAIRQGLVDTCLRWPPTAVAAQPLPDPPRVPALFLNGDLDLSTPLADARAEAARWPDARLVVVAGAGHGSTFTPCGARTLWRFVEGAALPSCRPAALPRVHRRYAVG